MAEQPTCRGYMIQSTKIYIDRTYDEATRNAIYDRVSPQVRDVLGSLDKVAWYPVGYASELFKAIAQHHQATDKKPEKALFDVGRTIAETATNTFLRLLLKFMTVSLFTRKIGDFWARDNRCGALTTESADLTKRHMVITHKGLTGYDYVAATAPGFITYAMEQIGCKNVRYESDWRIENPGADDVRYDVYWD